MVYASPYSPARFMKDTKNMLQGGDYYQSLPTWANYYVKFIESYEKESLYGV
jgi:glucosylceramidase